MNPRILTSIGLIFVLLTTGCTSIRNMDAPEADRLRVGEVINIYHVDNRVSRIIIDAISETEIVGAYVGTGRAVTIPRSDIASFDVERIDYLKSTAAGIGGAALVVVMATFIAFMSLLTY